MFASRFVCLGSKPLMTLLSSRVGPIWTAPCRIITTGKDQVKFGNIGGRVHIPDPTIELAPFLGKWVLQTKSTTGETPSILYEKDERIWCVDLKGIFEHLKNKYYCFRFGRILFMERKDDDILERVLIYQEGPLMRWQLQSQYATTNITHIITEVKDNKLVWNITAPDHTKSTKIFVRPEK